MFRIFRTTTMPATDDQGPLSGSARWEDPRGVIKKEHGKTKLT